MLSVISLFDIMFSRIKSFPRLLRFCSTKTPVGSHKFLAENSEAARNHGNRSFYHPEPHIFGGFRMRFPGFGFNDVDRKGNVNLWKPIEVAEGGRIAVWCAPSAEYNMEPFPTVWNAFANYLFFTFASRVVVTSLFYDKAVVYMQPLVLITRLGNVGGTSYQHMNELFTEQGHLVAQWQNFEVIADKQTRKPTSTEAAGIADILNIDLGRKFDKVPRLNRPDDVSSVAYEVQWSDTDFYFHVGNTTYVKICLDGINRLSLAGNLTPQFSGDIAERRVTSMTLMYLGESVPGDGLETFCWPHSTQPNVLLSQIVKEGKVIFENTLTFE